MDISLSISRARKEHLTQSRARVFILRTCVCQWLRSHLGNTFRSICSATIEAFRASSPRMCIWQSTLALLPLSLPRLVWLNFCLLFSSSRTKEVFYASPRICSSFQNREEPLAHFEKRFCLFPALQKVMMVLKTLLNNIVENFVTIWR